MVNLVVNFNQVQKRPQIKAWIIHLRNCHSVNSINRAVRTAECDAAWLLELSAVIVLDDAADGVPRCVGQTTTVVLGVAGVDDVQRRRQRRVLHRDPVDTMATLLRAVRLASVSVSGWVRPAADLVI